MSADWYRKHNRYNFLPRRYQAADSGSSLMGGNAYASMQHRFADILLYIQSPIRRSPARMDCGVFGFDKVWTFSLSTSRKNFILLLWRACSLYGRAFLYPFFDRKETKTLSLSQPTLWFRFLPSTQTSKLEEITMKKINLRDYYPYYTQDMIVEVPDEVALLLREYMLLEEAYRIRTYR